MTSEGIPPAVRSSYGALVFLFALTGCATNVGPTGLAVGGPCVDDLDCAAGSYCLRSLEFPSGTCTTNCRDDGDCRSGSRCVEVEAGVCLLSCVEDEDCGREGYSCRPRAQAGAIDTSNVCIGR